MISKDAERAFVRVLTEMLRVNPDRDLNEAINLALELSGMTERQWDNISVHRQKQLIDLAINEARDIR